jgi:uncharacterized protein (DUF2252 family)
MHSRTTAALIVSMFLCGHAAAVSEKGPFDRIDQAYAGSIDRTDPFAFDLKIASLANSSYTFWRGSKDLFFRWAKDHCTDWFDDETSLVVSHGDLHLGNIGSYLSDDRGRWPALAFGMVDFDDATRMPFQLELVQGIVTFELSIRASALTLTDAQRKSYRDRLFETYRVSLNSQRDATELLREKPLVAKLLSDSAPDDYGKELDQYLDEGRAAFRSTVVTKKGVVKEVLREVDADQRSAFAAALCDAIRNSAPLRERMTYTSPRDVELNIVDIAQRTRIGSSGSQGLEKYLVLMRKPFKGIDHDVILYLKQEIPTAAERSKAVSIDPRSPGERTARDQIALTDPDPVFVSWCSIGSRSFWVHLKEPWSDELSADNVKSADELIELAEVWGTVAGSAHRLAISSTAVRDKLTPELRSTIESRADAYVDQLLREYDQFVADERVADCRRRAEAAIAAASK